MKGFAGFGGALFLCVGILGLLIVYNHLGVAQQFANYLLILLLVVFFYSVFFGKRSEIDRLDSNFSSKLIFLGWVGILVSTFLIFRSLFSSGPAVWGDAPYFYPEAFKEFSTEPLVWEARGRLGVVNDLYWLYPLMFIYRGLGTLGLSNDLVIRIVFYFPALFLALFSPWLLTRHLGFSPLVSLFSTLVYGLSTYFILVVDGGQIGVALAYGVFPLSLLELLKLMTNRSKVQFFSSLAVFMLLVIADVRFAALAIFTIVVWQGAEKITSLKETVLRNWRTFSLFGLAVLGLSAYWLLPAIFLEPTTGSGIRSDLRLISVLNPLFLYAPHWPLNEFGKTAPVPWYFIGITILIFANLFFKLTRQILALVFCFALFAFLAKGETGLLGNLYSWFTDTIPLGGAFRDSTKFFTPLNIFAGILIGLTAENLVRGLKRKWISRLSIVLIFSYLLFLLHPAILQNMHGVLNIREIPQSLAVIAQKLASDKGFLRTVWFPERHPLSFHTEAKPTLDAKSLVNLRPFAALNTGTLDVFNFLQSEESLEWFSLIGAKYLIFPGETRKVDLTLAEKEDWKALLDLVNQKNLHRVDWKTDLPIYEIDDPKPRIFGLRQAVAVVGPDDIYKRIKEVSPKFSIGNQGFIFIEDGKTDPHYLLQIVPDSTILVFNYKHESDLVLSFLEQYFLSPAQSKKADWAIRSSTDYLKWKYELLVNNNQTREFDYQKGIAFSTRGGEKIAFELNTPDTGEYELAVRSMSGPGEEILNVSIDNQNFEITHKTVQQFSWYIMDLNLARGKHELILENAKGFQVLNTVALIPKVKWEKAIKETKELMGKMRVFNLDQDEIKSLSEVLSNNKWQAIDYKQRSPTEYEVTVPDQIEWVLFTDNYHKDWKIQRLEDETGLPFYSMVNGFFIPVSGKYTIVFSGQESVRLGLYISLLALLSSLLAYLVVVHRKSE